MGNFRDSITHKERPQSTHSGTDRNIHKKKKKKKKEGRKEEKGSVKRVWRGPRGKYPGSTMAQKIGPRRTKKFKFTVWSRVTLPIPVVIRHIWLCKVKCKLNELND